MTAWLSEALIGPRLAVRATASGDQPALAALALDPDVHAHIVRLVTGWFATAFPGEALIAVTQEANIRSIRLLERAGAQHTSTFEQYGLPQRQYEFRL